MSSQRKIFKGNHNPIIINEDGTINDDALINSDTATTNIKPPCTNSKPTITNYHQGEMIDFETYLEMKPSDDLIQDNQESNDKQLDEENDRKIRELMQKKNIKLSHNYKPFLENKKE